MGMIEDWVNGNFAAKNCPKPLKIERTASSDKIFRAQSVAPPASKIKSPNTANYCHDRANSAPPAPPQPFRRFVSLFRLQVVNICTHSCQFSWPNVNVCKWQLTSSLTSLFLQFVQNCRAENLKEMRLKPTWIECKIVKTQNLKKVLKVSIKSDDL